MSEENQAARILIPEKAESLLNYNPSEELKIAQEIIGGGGPQTISAAAAAAEEVIYQGPDSAFLPGDVIKGVRFDPNRHICWPNGQPKLGSRKQLKLQKEFKKSAGKRVLDKAKEAIGMGTEEDADEDHAAVEEIPHAAEIHEERLLFDDIPPSDDEIPEISAEEREIPAASSPRDERRADRDAKKAANAIVLGAGIVVGGEIHRQKKSEEFGDLVGACKEWQEETGHTVDLPPNITFMFAAIGSTLAMAKNEPACKERLDTAATMVRHNVLGTLGEKFPVLKVLLGSDATEEIPAAVEESEAE